MKFTIYFWRTYRQPAVDPDGFEQLNKPLIALVPSSICARERLMAKWSEILHEVNRSNPEPTKDLDGIRRKYLGKLAEVTGRNATAFSWFEYEFLPPHKISLLTR